MKFKIAVAFILFCATTTSAQTFDPVQNGLQLVDSDDKLVGAVILSVVGDSSNPPLVISKLIIFQSNTGALTSVAIDESRPSFFVSNDASFFEFADCTGVPFASPSAPAPVNTKIVFVPPNNAIHRADPSTSLRTLLSFWSFDTGCTNFAVPSDALVSPTILVVDLETEFNPPYRIREAPDRRRRVRCPLRKQLRSTR